MNKTTTSIHQNGTKRHYQGQPIRHQLPS
uniref:Uncharacterized protein n=1 Tax=Rhizophora mucronata TaxID=61149 RepID=A0A2P2NPJ1_RHIMU